MCINFIHILVDLPFKDHVVFDFSNFPVLILCGVILNTKIVFST